MNDRERLGYVPPEGGFTDERDAIDEAIVNHARVTGVGMDAATPLQEHERAAIRERWANVHDTERVTLGHLAKAIGAAAGTLSQVLNGNYDGSAETIDATLRQVDDWLTNRQAQGDGPTLPGFVTTRVAEMVAGYVKLARSTGSMVVIVGESGCGKTMALKAVAGTTAGAIYMSITPGNRRDVTFLRELCGLVGLERVHALDALWRAAVHRLNGTGRTLIVDEADLANLDLLTCIRRLRDETGIAVVLSGQRKLAETLAVKAMDGSKGATLHSRTMCYLNIDELAGDDGGERLYTTEDVQRVLAQSKVRVAPDALRWLGALANLPDYGRLRAACTLLLSAQIHALHLRKRRDVIDVEFLKALFVKHSGKTVADRVASAVRDELSRMVG
ncbi:MAG: AAA family ATPase [Phycisphaerales bacterium]|nr:AAA family ATPase [Phycisphaerales bacterium]